MAGRNTRTNTNGSSPKTDEGHEVKINETVDVAEEAASTENKAKSARRARVIDPEEVEAEAEIGFAPKTFLIPYVLLMLRDSLLHGYAIWERLMLMGIPGLDESDRATIYRTLRQLEREGKVKSEWDTRTEGPARRVYTLTDAGKSFLQIWAVGLDQYRQSLDFFFKLYTGGAIRSPFDFNFNSRNSDKNPNTKGGNNHE
ncbi:MAG TPA: helix-turn-helix transcriptional regulator [Chloroflexia bacterium]|nr:helix-turn-helix transcriptional regulator [Chloroflexia bacterium]